MRFSTNYNFNILVSTRLVVTAYRKTLGPDDIWDQTPKLKSDTVVPPLEEAWEREQKACCERYL